MNPVAGLAVVCVLCMPIVHAQTMKPAKPAGAIPKTPYYFDPSVLNLIDLIPPPPPVNSAANKAELTELHRIEKARTPSQVSAASTPRHNCPAA